MCGVISVRGVVSECVGGVMSGVILRTWSGPTVTSTADAVLPSLLTS